MPKIRGVLYKTRVLRISGIMRPLVTWFSFLNFSLDRPIADFDRGYSGHPVLYGLGVLPAAVTEELLENVLQSVCTHAADALFAAI